MSERVGGIFYDVTLDTGQMINAQRKVKKSLSSMGDAGDRLSTRLSAVGAAIASMFAAGAIIAIRSAAPVNQRGIATWPNPA